MSFQVTLQSSGHSFPVERGQCVLEAALHHGIGLPYGCRNGACGSCIAQLVSGEIHYPDGEPDALEGCPVENPVVLCKAHPQSDLIIAVREVQAIFLIH